MTSTFTILTFEDLIEIGEGRQAKARGPGKIAGWQRLLGVARDQAGPGSAGNDFIGGRTWSLLRIHITGYQGVSADHTLELDLDPTPGITVLHGPNGSGKTSIADAVETALHGAPRQTATPGAGGKLPLWDREHTGRDARAASVELTLGSGDRRLRMSCHLDSAGRVTDREVELTDEVGSRSVGLPPTWGSALAGHRPVFGYAAVERQVQMAKDLQEFLEPLLAFGGCFETLKLEVERQGASAASAYKRWVEALANAKTIVARVDDEHMHLGSPALAALAWPSLSDNTDAWLSENELTDRAQTVAEVTADHQRRLSESATAALDALVELRSEESSLHARLAGPLRDLHAAASELSDPGATCPVCAAHDAGWLDALRLATAQLADAPELQDRFQEAARQVRDSAKSTLTEVVGALQLAQEGSPEAAARDEVVASAATLVTAIDTHGLRATATVKIALRDHCEIVTSESWASAAAKAVDESDHRRQWLRRRRGAVDSFITTWREVRDEAAAGTEWKAATGCLNDLQDELRVTRAENLKVLTGSALDRLLADVGIRITTLSVQGTKADFKIEDAHGGSLKLSMLSAGQRNALLLAPLLAVSRDGPFAFLVLDDPVHAFDQIRVDRLASILGELARDRRVLVLTHDERLKEHVVARVPNCDVRAVQRDPVTGRVSVESTGALWKVLVDDARAALQLPGGQPGGVTIEPTDLVRGLCRMAMDNALRQFVTKNAVRHGRDPGPDLTKLDTESTTAGRLKCAKALSAAGSPERAAAEATEARISAYTKGWNMAAHGNPAISVVTDPEIDAADLACQDLVRLP